jgi:hypothetical protein
MASEIGDLLAALKNGSMSLDEVAQRFRDRSWPRHGYSSPASYLDLAARAQEDPDPYLPGSFDDVAAAFHNGQLSGDEYDVLAKAMAESMRAEDEGRGAV